MKKRISRVVNFFAFNLLFFALYLNFIHKDNSFPQAIVPATATPPIQGTVLVEHPDQYLNKANAAGNAAAIAGLDKTGSAKNTTN